MSTDHRRAHDAGFATRQQTRARARALAVALRAGVPGTVAPAGAAPPMVARVYDSRAAWVEDGRMWRMRSERAAWGLGDWLVAGREWDPSCTLAAQITGYSASHLHNVRRCAMAWPLATRSYNLSFAAHLLLLREPDDVRRLELHALAVASAWTTDDLRRYFMVTAAEAVPEALPAPRADPLVTPRVRCVQCPACASVFPIKGHKV